MILESSVGQGVGCFCGGQKMVLGQGATARNGHAFYCKALSSSYNAAIGVPTENWHWTL